VPAWVCGRGYRCLRGLCVGLLGEVLRKIIIIKKELS
jgi:hypothetical protein